jgi:16S rRNA (cytosine967-C5)-methyltransferase
MTQLEEHRVKDLYEGVRGVAVKVLNRVERTDSYLDKLLDSELRNSELSSADKALLFEIVHGVVRWMGRLDWILNGFYKGQFSKAIPNLKNGLRVALYQIMFLDKIPDHAAVNEAVEFVKKLQGQKPADLTNAILRNIIRSKNAIRYPNPEEDLPGYIAAYYSHPSWMVKRYLERFGREATEKLLETNNERPQLTLKVNTLKTTTEEFKKLLHSVGLKYTSGKFLPEFIRLYSLSNITQWKYFQEGYFDIQDESAGLAVRLLGVKPGMRVLDLCAAPGGKTSYIAALMKNSGELVTLDKYESRIKILQKNITRQGFDNIKILEEDALQYKDEVGFDRVLADVPCSGTGTLSKKPDIKWKKDLLDVRKSAVLQQEFIEKAASLVKTGGALVYSTCSIEPEENIDIVRSFLDRHPEFILQNARDELSPQVVDENGCVQTYPHLHNTDGAFAAKLVKIKTT